MPPINEIVRITELRDLLWLARRRESWDPLLESGTCAAERCQLDYLLDPYVAGADHGLAGAPLDHSNELQGTEDAKQPGQAGDLGRDLAFEVPLRDAHPVALRLGHRTENMMRVRRSRSPFAQPHSDTRQAGPLRGRRSRRTNLLRRPVFGLTRHQALMSSPVR